MDMTDDNLTRLIFVRHGESDANVQHILGGEKSCTGLSELGVRQVTALRDRLAKEPETSIDVLYSSTMPRARETAEIVNGALGSLQIHFDNELVEHRPGEADGIPFSELVERFGTNDYQGRPHSSFASGAETAKLFDYRVSLALETLLEKHKGSTVMIVCHGGVIDIAFRHFLELPRRSQFDLWTLNASLTEFAVDDKELNRGRWRLVKYNDHAHLSGLPFETTQTTY
jgi:probable phosphoglycerate mutase